MPCQGKTPTGKPCRRKVPEDAPFCDYHRREATRPAKTGGPKTEEPEVEATEERPAPTTPDEEDQEFDLAIEDAAWWPGYTRWLDKRIRAIAEEVMRDK